jgi:hypothetical protein
VSMPHVLIICSLFDWINWSIHMEATESKLCISKCFALNSDIKRLNYCFRALFESKLLISIDGNTHCVRCRQPVDENQGVV